MKNRFRDVVAAGKIPVGHMVWEFATRGIAKIADSTGLDFIIYDMEHSAFDVDKIADLMAWAQSAKFTPFVRVPFCDYQFMARLMDAGAMGIMVGNVKNAEEANRIVQAVKFAPLGNRGVGLGSAHTGYTVPDPLTYFREINQSSVIICQIESQEGVDNAEAIAAIEGVDILWVGHFDLSTSLGIPGQFNDPLFLTAIRKTVAAARKHGKLLGIQPGTPQQLESWLAAGFNVISWSVDSAVYRAALLSGVEAVRAMTIK